jgi:DHA1 family multidrug/chloramphenicol efflux transport protein-like MFS transporter
MIELVRYLYTQFHLWAFVLSAFAFIALWFTQPRLALKCRKELHKTYIKKIPEFIFRYFLFYLISCSKVCLLNKSSGKVSNNKLICFKTSV